MEREARRTRHLLVPLVAALFVIVGAFAFSSAMTERTEEEISVDARDISENAMPSVAALAMARTELVRLDQRVNVVQRWCELGRPVEDGAPEKGLLNGVRDQVQGYLAIRPFSGVGEFRSSIVRGLDQIDGLLEQFLRKVQQSECRQARDLMDDVLGPSIQQEIELMGRVNSLNLSEAQRLGREISDRRERAQRLSALLDSLAVLITFLVLGLVAAVIRRNARVAVIYAQQQRERADELDMFAARVAHDIRSPLTTLQVGLQTLRKLEEREAPAEKRLVSIKRSLASVGRVNAVITDLLEFARAGARPTPGVKCDVRAVVSAVEEDLRPAAEAVGMTVVVEPFPDGQVQCGPGVLMSLISNLVQNAIKHARTEGGAITIRIHGDEMVRFEVADKGPGLPPGQEEHLFAPYARGDTSAPGLGLGLATVKRLSEVHGGSCGVDSIPGKGSTFWFTLPMARPDGVDAGSGASPN